MSGTRETGRYNLHRLGWSAFEDLCVQIMRHVLGEACTRFPAGKDGGVDGWYGGSASDKLSKQNKLEGNFVLQCKHSSQEHNLLALSDLAEEVKKVEAIAAKAPCNYLLLTNRPITAPSSEKIREAFAAIKGVTGCLILGESWIEDTIDREPRLLRLIWTSPRLMDSV